MNIHYLRDAESIAKHRDKLLAAPELAVDAETTDLVPQNGKLRLLQLSTDAENCVIFDFFHINPLDSRLDFVRDIFADESKVKVFHNGKFDAKWLKHHAGGREFRNAHDTYISSQLLACGDDDLRHGLGAVAARFAFLDIDKSQQKSDWNRPDLSNDQIRYAAMDSMALHLIRAGQIKHLAAADMKRVALLECDAVDAYADMENAGFFLNKEQWLERVIADETLRETCAAKLHAHFKSITKQTNMFSDASDVNIDSHDDITRALKELGVPIEDSTLEWKIKDLGEKWPVVSDLIAYRGVAQSLKTFGRSYLDFINALTGRIHADFKQIGTPTGRSTCKDPNLQQVPAESRFRNCFQAPDGRKLIIADYSQIELRIMGQFSRDEKLCRAYNEDRDLHRQTAAEVFHVDFENVSDEQRGFGKRLNFGTAYGIGAPRFAKNAGISVSDSQQMLDAFWRTYSTLDEFLKEAGRRAVADRETHSFSGRTQRFSFDDADQQAISAVERNGRNFSIQATSSDILKRALYLLRSQIDTSKTLRQFKNAWVVNIVHDEIVVECDADQAEDVMRVVDACMVDAGSEVLTALPCKVDAKIADKWSK